MSLTIYKSSILTTSIDIADMGEGLTTGTRRIESDGRQYVLLFTGEDLPNGEMCTLDAAEATETVLHVDIAGVNDGPLGCNNTGSEVVENKFFWAIVHGIGYARYAATLGAVGLALECAAIGEVGILTSQADFRLGYGLETGTDSNLGAVYFTL